MADINDQYLQNLRVAIFQFARESSNFTSILTDVFNNLDSSSTKSSKQIDNSTKSVKGFGDAISSSSNYLKDFKSYVSNNSKTVAESSKIVKEYTSQLADLKQKSIDINRNWGALNSSLRSTIAATESTARQHERNVAQTTSDYFQARDDLSKARQAVKQAQQDFASAFASGNVDAIDKAADIASAAQNLLKSTRDSVTALADKTQELKKLDVGKAELNAKIAQQNQELYTNIYDTFGNSLLKIDNLINEKTSTWKGLTGSIDELAKEAFKDTSLDISKEFQKNGIPGLHDYNKALAQALLELEKSGGIINESNYYILDNFQKFAERVGDSSDTVKNLNDKLNEHVKNVATELAAGRDTSKIQTGLAPDTVEKLTKSYEGNIDALDKFSKSINKTFTRHQIAFSTIIDKQLSEQSNIFGKFIYNFGKGAVQGGDVGSAGMERALNEFTGSLREGILPSLKSIALGSKDYITSEAQALFNSIKLDRVASQQLQEGDSASLKKLADSKAIWQNMEGGIDAFTKNQLDTSKTFRDVIGVDAEMRTKEFVELMKTQMTLGVLDTSGKGGVENEKKLRDILAEAKKISDAGIYSQTQTLEIFNNTVRSAEFLKVSAGMDKKRRTAQEMEVMTTIKFASALNMSTEAAKAFAIASATAGANLSPQQMISNVATTLKTQNILDYYAKELGVKSEISDTDRAKMSEIENKPAQMRTEQEKEFFDEFLLKMVKQHQDEQTRLTDLQKEAEARGDTAASKQYAAMAVQLGNQFDTSIAEYSGGEKDIIAAFVKQYPTIDMAKIEKDRKEGESITQAIMRNMDKKSEEKTAEKDTMYNDTIINLSTLAAQWKAFTENIVGSNILALGTAALGIISVVADLGKVASMLGVGTAVAGAGTAAAGAAGAAGAVGGAGLLGGLGAAATAILPELLAALGIAAGVGALAYGAKGLYDYFTKDETKADIGDAIHGMVDVNNLDMYTNQVTDAIYAQTQELLKGFSSSMCCGDISSAITTQTQELLSGFTNIMGKPVEISNPVTTNTENVQQKTNLVPETSLPFPGYKPYNPTYGTQNIPNIEQNALVSPTATINNTDISLALDDLKAFLAKEMISAMLSKFDTLITNTGTTATNTGDDGTLGKLVDVLSKPASQPFARGRVEDAMTLTT